MNVKVLLAIDSSTISQGLIENAASRPWPARTRFVALHVVDMAALGRFATMLEEEKKSGQRLVAGAVERLLQAGLDSTSEVLIGFPRKTIVEYAKESGANLVMLGSHGQSAIARFLLGSVAQAVLRSAPCSVEIMRLKSKNGWSKGKGMKIILATDGSENSAAAAKSIISRPWPEGTKVKVISVAELVVPGSEMIASSSSPVYPASLLEQIWSDARERAHEAVTQARKILETAKIPAAVEGYSLEGDPRVVLLDQARNWDADLIILGSHGRHGIDRALMGSVSESVAMHAHCSVGVIRGVEPEESAARS
jgi:nucleotide-binding universal stress UspA family protein